MVSSDAGFNLNILDLVLLKQFVAIYFTLISSMNIDKRFLDETLCDSWKAIKNSSFAISRKTGAGTLLEFSRKLFPRPIKFSMNDDDCFELGIFTSSSL